jgi:hypothetical protein
MAMILQLDSINRWAGDGVTTDWDFSFSGGYIDKAHVKAYTVAADRTRSGIPVTAAMFVTPFRLRLPVTPIGAEVTIYRDTPKDLPLVEFEDGTAITEPALNLMARQAVFIAAEFTDATTVVVKGGTGNSLINALDDIEYVLNAWAESTLNELLESWKLEALSELELSMQQYIDSEVSSLEASLQQYINSHMPPAVDLDPYGFKEMVHVDYGGPSTVSTGDRGRAHCKLDSSSVYVPNSLPTGFTCNIINLSSSSVTVSFSDAAYMQGTAISKSSWSLLPNQILHIHRAASDRWFISGFAE